MHLIYVDDYGHTGADLGNQQQPIYMLFALVVPELQWPILEPSLWGIITDIADKTGQDLEGFELHAKDFLNGRNKTYRALTFEEKIDYIDRIVTLVKLLGCTCVATYVVKSDLQMMREVHASRKAEGKTTPFEDRSLAILLPHPMAFSRLLGEIDSLCRSTNNNAVIILDHQEEYVESRQLHSHMIYRNSNSIDNSRILDMPFDGDGRYNIILQIADVLGYVYGRYLQAELLKKGIKEEFLTLAEKLKPIITSVDAFDDFLPEELPFTTTIFAEYGMRDDKKQFPASVRVAQLTAMLLREDDATEGINEKGQGALE